MSNIPKELRYTKSHEWVKIEKDGTCRVGITDHAQSALGDLVFIELPTIDLKSGDECCTVESVKAASDVFAPISGTIVEVNTKLEESPNIVNSDPYGEGWLFHMKPTNPSEIENLLTAEDYEKVE